VFYITNKLTTKNNNKMKKLSKLNKIGVAIFLTIHLPLIISVIVALIEQIKLNNL